MIALLLAILCGTANALEVRAPSPNSGTITPTAITAVTGSFSGSVTASSVTANGYKAVYGMLASTMNVGGSAQGYKLTVGDGSVDGGFSPLATLMAIGTRSNHPLYIVTGDSTRAVFDTSGSVGIGTASPCSTCTLHVAGGASVTGAFAVASATFTVATTGIVSAPSQPFVRALDYGQNLANGLNRMYFSAPAAGSDPASMYGGAASSGTFTIPAGGGGFYAIGVSFLCTTQHAYGFQIKVNGSVVKQTTYAGVAGQDGASVEVKIKLNAGDTVEAFAYSDTSGVTTAGANFGSFEMVKLW